MTAILVCCLAVCVASVLALALRGRLFPGVPATRVAGLAVLADLTAVVAAILALAGLLGRHLLGRGTFDVVDGWVVAACLLAQAVGMIVLRRATRPRDVPRHVEPTWALPTEKTIPVTVLVHRIVVRDGVDLVEAFDADGNLHILTSHVDRGSCGLLVGHRAVALVSPDGGELVDLVDLGTCQDEGPQAGQAPPR